MKTLTLFEAMNGVTQFIEEDIQYVANRYDLPHDEMVATNENITRRIRQRNTFVCAIRARLTPPAPKRKRVWRVSVGYVFAFFDRTDDELGEGYRITKASRARLERVCNQHMIGDGLHYGVEIFEREVQA